MPNRHSQVSFEDTISRDNQHHHITDNGSNNDIINSNGSSTNVKRTGSTSSNYENINANLHARVKAFQEQRALKRSASTGTNVHSSNNNSNNKNKNNNTSRSANVIPTESNIINNNNNNNNNINQSMDMLDLQMQQQSYSTSKNINKIVNKPLPPLPSASQESLVSQSSNASKSSLHSQSTSKSNSPSRKNSSASLSLNNSTKDIRSNNISTNIINNNSNENLLNNDISNDINDNYINNDNTNNNNNNNNSIINETSTTYTTLIHSDEMSYNKDNNTLSNHINTSAELMNKMSELKINRLNNKQDQMRKTLDPNNKGNNDSNSKDNDDNNNNNNNNNNNSSSSNNNNTTTPSESINRNNTNSMILNNIPRQALPQRPLQFNPSRRAPKRPIPSVRAPGTIPQQQQSPIISQQSQKTHKLPSIIGGMDTIAQTRPKQSLSARRGLKLPPGGMSLKSLNKSPTSSSSQASNLVVSNTPTHSEFASLPENNNSNNKPHHGKRSNPGSLINGVQSTSTSSADREQNDTEGTTPPSSFSLANRAGAGSNANRGSNNSSGSSGSGGLFSSFSKYVDIKSGSLNFAGKLSLSSKGIDFNNGSSSRITLDELEFIEELGHGNYGNVSKVLHKPTNIIMAMKEVRLELDEAKFRQILMELEILHKCKSPFIVDFYGAFFIEGAVYMCMEFMDGGSLDKIYDQNPEIGGIDEPQLAFITDAVIKGLRELKDVHNIIHRDVKPTNVLCSAKQGTIKLCDFGVSGNLVASMAKTNIGCQSYMAPERIKSLNPDIATYTVQSDVWSLGLSILEMALGRYPYPPETFDNIFSQLSAIVDGPPPRLPTGKFSAEAQDFVSLCLQKKPERRPTYAMLSEHPWLVKHRKMDVGMSRYITERLNKKKKILEESGEDSLPKAIPALHMGGLQ